MTSIILDILAIIMMLFTILLLLTGLSYLFYTRIPYVPSKTRELEKFLSEQSPDKNNHFYDLGAGDGRVLFLAEKFGLQPIGYEVSPLPYLLARLGKIFRRSKARIYFKNFLKANLKDAKYVYCYLFPEMTGTLYEKACRECRPGTYFICNTFSLKSVRPEQTYFDKKQKPKLFIYKI